MIYDVRDIAATLNASSLFMSSTTAFAVSSSKRAKRICDLVSFSIDKSGLSCPPNDPHAPRHRTARSRRCSPGWLSRPSLPTLLPNSNRQGSSSCLSRRGVPLLTEACCHQHGSSARRAMHPGWQHLPAARSPGPPRIRKSSAGSA